MSYEPACAIVTGRPWVSDAGTPFGSPKPPVCTFAGAAAIVGVAELPVENTFVLTGGLGIIGFLAGSVTLGACSSGTGGFFFWTNSAGTRMASGRGVTGSEIFGTGRGKCLTGAGACGIGGGGLTRLTKWESWTGNTRTSG